MILLTHNLKDFILTLNQEQIMAYYFNLSELDIKNIVSNQTKIHNPLRTDKNPSLTFYYYNNNLRSKDWGDSTYTGDIFHIAGIRYSLNCNNKKDFIEICNRIKNKFIDKKREFIPYIKTTKLDVIKKISKIDVEYRYWDRFDKAYWNKIYLSYDILEKELIFPVNRLWINDKLYYFYNSYKDLCYCYNQLGVNIYKLYFPLRDKKQNARFITNNTQIFEGLKTLNEGEDLIITKSTKDRCVLKYNLLPFIKDRSFAITSFNGEGQRINEKIAKYLNSKYNEIYCNIDFDFTGIQNAIFHYYTYGFKPLLIGNDFSYSNLSKVQVNTIINSLQRKNIVITKEDLKSFISEHRDERNNCKDFSEYVEIKGLNKSINLLKRLI